MLAIISLFGVLLLTVAAIYLNNKLSRLNDKVNSIKSESDINNEIEEMVSGDLDTKKLQTFSNQLFLQLNKKYEFNAQSYSDLLEKIKISEKLDNSSKQIYTTFINELVGLLYQRDEHISETEKENLKKEMKLIISKLKS